MVKNYDFAGWATKNDLRCADGRVIRRDAFKDCDGKTVPVVWNHNHESVDNVLGHALLKNCKDGVRAYVTVSNTPSGQAALEHVKSGDLTAMSIYANQLKQHGGDVLHGMIREVSLVLAGANPGAFIDDIAVAHGEDGEGEAFIYGDDELELWHSEEATDDDEKDISKQEDDRMANGKEKTVKDVFDTLTEEQKNVVYAIIGAALDNNGGDEEDDDVKHNVFENDNNYNSMAHSMDEINGAMADAKRCGSMKEAFLQHGIDDVEWLFPEDHVLDTPPRIIDNRNDWVSTVMGAVHHVPFSRVKSMFADLTEEDARAKGYIKGHMKKEQVFGLLKRSTSPTTIYKKQKMDRDDVIDITSFDVVAWLKQEMRVKLNEEIARAILIGDGRDASSDDKINEQNIRPIVNDDDLFTIKTTVTAAAGATADEKCKAAIKAIIKSRKDYKGSGNPTFFTTEDMLTDMLLLEDTIGHPLYADEAALAKKLRVKNIVTIPQMEGYKGKNGGDLVGIIVNLSDYTVGADKGGAVSMFDDFDIDYNAQKYLIETRCSGALTVPYSAIAVEFATT